MKPGRRLLKWPDGHALHSGTLEEATEERPITVRTADSSPCCEATLLASLEQCG